MTKVRTWDPDWISRAEARAILGATNRVLDLLIAEGQVHPAARKSRRFSRAEVTRVADERADLINAAEAAAILGVNRARVGQLVEAGRLPCVWRGRVRRFRRAQVEVIANARRARWHSDFR